MLISSSELNARGRATAAACRAPSESSSRAFRFLASRQRPSLSSSRRASEQRLSMRYNTAAREREGRLQHRSSAGHREGRRSSGRKEGFTRRPWAAAGRRAGACAARERTERQYDSERDPLNGRSQELDERGEDELRKPTHLGELELHPRARLAVCDRQVLEEGRVANDRGRRVAMLVGEPLTARRAGRVSSRCESRRRRGWTHYLVTSAWPVPVQKS